MSEENKAIGRCHVEEAINQRDVSVIDRIFAPDFVEHTKDPSQPSGVEALKYFLMMLRTGFPNFQDTIEDLFPEGDKVALRFTFRGTH
jgi:predicted ester cyclase